MLQLVPINSHLLLNHNNSVKAIVSATNTCPGGPKTARQQTVRILILIPAVLVCLPIAAEDSKDQQRFAGTWEAKFKDTVICTIKLEGGDTISGSTNRCKIHVTLDGDLLEPEPSDSVDEPSPILNSKIQGDVLSFQIKDKDEDPMKLELKLTSPGKAELRFVEAPVKIKPIHFEKR